MLLVIPALLPARFSETNGAKIWIRFPGFSIQRPSSPRSCCDLLRLGAGGQAQSVHQRGKHVLGMDLPARATGPLLVAWIASVGSWS